MSGILAGYVSGWFSAGHADGPDEDRLPDIKGDTELKVTLTPEVAAVIDGDPPRFFRKKSIPCTIRESDGVLLDPQGGEGIWLPVGTWVVDTAGAFDRFRIMVGLEHTEASPLALVDWYTNPLPPGAPVQTVVLPAGGQQGQYLTPSGVGELLWTDLPAGGGEGGPVDWDDVDDKPTEFPPAEHEHPLTEVVGLEDALADKAPIEHEHDGYQPAGDYVTDDDARLSDARPPMPHEHPPGQVTGLAAALAARPTSMGITHVTAITRADYDALTTPDPTTLYVIREA